MPLVNAPVGEGAGDGGASAMPGRVARNPVVPSVEPWTNGSRAGERIITGHYSIRTTVRNGDLRRLLPKFAEAALAQYASALGELPHPSGTLETLVFGSRDEWAAYTKERLGPEAAAYMELGRGGYTSRATAILYDIGPNDTLTILAHEGWHQYSQSVFREELPVWLEEGIATFMEGHRIAPDSGDAIFSSWRNLERFGELREAVRRERLIPLEELLQKTPQEFLAEGRERLLVYYAQVWALTHFFAEGANGKYRAALVGLLTDAVTGQISRTLKDWMSTNDDRRAIQRAMSRGGIRGLPGTLVARGYFSENFAEFAAQYDAFVRQICGRGSGEFIWRGVSPIPRVVAEPVPADEANEQDAEQNEP